MQSVEQSGNLLREGRSLNQLQPMTSMSTFSPGLQRILRSALSSKAAVVCARFALPSGREEKAEGSASFYYWALRKDLILLLYAYPKNVTADLTPKQISQLAKVVKEEFAK